MSKFTKRNSKAAKINATIVQEIRDKYASGYYTQSSLSIEYQLSVVQIGRIVRGESWQGAATQLRPASRQELDEMAQRLLATQREVELSGPQTEKPPTVLPMQPESVKIRDDWFASAKEARPPKSAFDADYVPPEETLEGGSGLDKLAEVYRTSGDGLLEELKGDEGGSK